MHRHGLRFAQTSRLLAQRTPQYQQKFNKMPLVEQLVRQLANVAAGPSHDGHFSPRASRVGASARIDRGIKEAEGCGGTTIDTAEHFFPRGHLFVLPPARMRQYLQAGIAGLLKNIMQTTEAPVAIGVGAIRDLGLESERVAIHHVGVNFFITGQVKS